MVRFCDVSYGAVRFGLVKKKTETIRCGSARFSDIFCESYVAVRFCDNPTVRYGFFVIILRCGLVRFSNIENATVRFGAVLETRKSNGEFGYFFQSYGAVLCGFPNLFVKPTVRCGAVFEERQEFYIDYKGAVRCG